MVVKEIKPRWPFVNEFLLKENCVHHICSGIVKEYFWTKESEKVPLPSRDTDQFNPALK